MSCNKKVFQQRTLAVNRFKKEEEERQSFLPSLLKTSSSSSPSPSPRSSIFNNLTRDQHDRIYYNKKIYNSLLMNAPNNKSATNKEDNDERDDDYGEETKAFLFNHSFSTLSLNKTHYSFIDKFKHKLANYLGTKRSINNNNNYQDKTAAAAALASTSTKVTTSLFSSLMSTKVHHLSTLNLFDPYDASLANSSWLTLKNRFLSYNDMSFEQRYTTNECVYLTLARLTKEQHSGIFISPQSYFFLDCSDNRIIFISTQVPSNVTAKSICRRRRRPRSRRSQGLANNDCDDNDEHTDDNENKNTNSSSIVSNILNLDEYEYTRQVLKSIQQTMSDDAFVETIEQTVDAFNMGSDSIRYVLFKKLQDDGDDDDDGDVDSGNATKITKELDLDKKIFSDVYDDDDETKLIKNNEYDITSDDDDDDDDDDNHEVDESMRNNHHRINKGFENDCEVEVKSPHQTKEYKQQAKKNDKFVIIAATHSSSSIEEQYCGDDDAVFIHIDRLINEKTKEMEKHLWILIRYNKMEVVNNLPKDMLYWSLCGQIIATRLRARFSCIYYDIRVYALLNDAEYLSYLKKMDDSKYGAAAAEANNPMFLADTAEEVLKKNTTVTGDDDDGDGGSGDDEDNDDYDEEDDEYEKAKKIVERRLSQPIRRQVLVNVNIDYEALNIYRQFRRYRGVTMPKPTATENKTNNNSSSNKVKPTPPKRTSSLQSFSQLFTNKQYYRLTTLSSSPPSAAAAASLSSFSLTDALERSNDDNNSVSIDGSSVESSNTSYNDTSGYCSNTFDRSGINSDNDDYEEEDAGDGRYSIKYKFNKGGKGIATTTAEDFQSIDKTLSMVLELSTKQQLQHQQQLTSTEAETAADTAVSLDDENINITEFKLKHNFYNLTFAFE